VRAHSRSPPADPAELYGAVVSIEQAPRGAGSGRAVENDLGRGELDEAGTGVYETGV
jgi:hypothetical protein